MFPEDKYSFGNEFVSVTDDEGDNVILGEDGKLYFIDPIIRFKKPLRDIIDNYNRNNGSTLGEQIQAAEKEVNTTPTDKHKEACMKIPPKTKPFRLHHEGLTGIFVSACLTTSRLKNRKNTMLKKYLADYGLIISKNLLNLYRL